MPSFLRTLMTSAAALSMTLQPLPAFATGVSPAAIAAADEHIGGGINPLVNDLDAEAIFVQGGHGVLYRKGPFGQRRVLFADPAKGTTQLLIDDATLVARLRAGGATRAAGSVKLIDFTPATGILTVSIGANQWQVGLKDNKVRRKPAPPAGTEPIDDDEAPFSREGSEDQPTQAPSAEGLRASAGQVSPDGEWGSDTIVLQGGRGVLYRKGAPGRSRVLFADPAKDTAQLLIDDEALVAKLRAAGAVNAKGTVKLIDFTPDTAVLTIGIGPRQWLVGLKDNKVRQKRVAPAGTGAVAPEGTRPPPRPQGSQIQPRPSAAPARQAAPQSSGGGQEQASRVPGAQVSPDGKWEARVEDYNIVAIERATGRRIALTSDGNFDRRYGINYPRFGAMVETNSETPPMPIFLRWSPDSSQILTYRLDRNDSPIHTGVQMKPPGGGPARTFQYVYPNAGSNHVPDLRPMLIDVNSGAATMLDVPATPLLSPANPFLKWQGDRIHYLWKKRGFGEITLFEIDPHANKARPLVREALEPGVYDSMTIFRYAPALNGTLLVSERSGWAQLYLVRNGDAPDGGTRLTDGAWEVASIAHVKPGGPILVTGNGREKGVNPYYMMLYRVGLDGKTVNLTPEPMHHDVTVSSDGNYFIDRMSTPTTPTRTLLRRASDGAIVAELSRADPTKLTATGYVEAEVFQTMAQDGKTPLYATIYRPNNFDPTKSYPVIEHVYTGPTQRRFREDYRNNITGIPASLAQLGFIVVTIDAPGTARRGRAFRLPAYGKLWTVGVDEHVHVLQQIKAKYPYLDLARVGVAGHSAGGFDTFRFLIQRPDIYKAGVSSAGNHDMRLCKVWWPEMNMGFADEATWVANTGKTYAGKLQGKLLLVHGDIDENVPIATTQQLSEALTAAGKEHEFRIINNRGHGLAGDEFNKMMRDFFIRELRP